MGERQPRPILGTAGHALLDEIHPVHAVGHVRIHGVELRERLPGGPAGHVVVGTAVDVRERLEERLGVARGQPARGPPQVVHVRSVRVPRVQRMRMTIAAHHHDVRLFLPPAERPLRAIDLDEQVILPPVRDLAGGHCSQGPSLEADHGVAVVVESAAGLEHLQVRRDPIGQQPGHIAGQVVGVGGDVAEAASTSRLGRIGPPGGLLLPLRLQPASEPALNIERPHRLNLAQLSRLDHLPGLADQRVAGVVVRHGEDRAALLDQFVKLFGLGQVEGEWLVADDIKPGFQCRLGNGEVSVVRGRDGHEVDPLVGGEGPLLRQQLINRPVGPGERDVVVGSRRLGLFGARRERPGDQAGPIVEDRRGDVDPPDERSEASADQSHPQLAIQ